MRILSIDPGYGRIGMAIIQKEDQKNKEVLLFSQCFTTSSKVTIYERLFLIGQEVERIITMYQPQKLAIENLFFSTNAKTVMGVSQARGVILYEAKKANLAIEEYTPLQIKNATTGYGRAEKHQVYSMVQNLIEIPSGVKQDDEIDAIAVGLTAFAHHRF